MNVKTLINRMTIICVSLMVVGCQPLISGNIRCARTVVVDHMELAVEFYIKNDSIYLKMFARTPEGKMKKNIKLESGMHIYLEPYANPIFIVKDVSNESVILNQNGILETYQLDEGWDYDVVNSEMLKFSVCE